MVNNSNLLFILVGCFGALCMEMIGWIDKRKRIGQKDKRILNSGIYWLLTLLMVVVSGIGSFIIFYDEKVPVKMKIPFILGASFPAIFKKIVQVSQDGSLPKLGAGQKMSFRDVLKIYFK